MSCVISAASFPASNSEDMLSDIEKISVVDPPPKHKLKID